MGCRGLESGDAVLAIPFRYLNELRSSALPLSQQEDADEQQKIEVQGRPHDARRSPERGCHRCWAPMHMAAVRADRAPEPVRSFGTFTADLHRLVDWFAECGVETVVMDSTSVYWIPI